MSTPKQELMAALDEEHADAIIEYRRYTIKKPLTAFAAKRLAKQFAMCADPNEAAATMIDKCWQGFKSDWIGQASAPRHESDLQRMSRELRENNARAREDFGRDSEVVPLFSGQRQGR